MNLHDIIKYIDAECGMYLWLNAIENIRLIIAYVKYCWNQMKLFDMLSRKELSK